MADRKIQNVKHKGSPEFSGMSLRSAAPAELFLSLRSAARMPRDEAKGKVILRRK